MGEIEVRSLSASPAIVEALSDILIETVASGGSVTFMHPLERRAARAFWQGALAAAAQGERFVLGAFVDERIVGTATLLVDCPPNQPHRGEIAKMMTRPSHRGRGVASALLRAAEDIAAKHERTLLTLDTAAEDGASGFYEKLGYTCAGTIPDYAFKPLGGLTATMVYWKRIGARA
ncbi:MAG: GNAT family N-acetyltransferase [Roseiarcus sp.]|jgi:GNAT superfamily N-acetyltransferase